MGRKWNILLGFNHTVAFDRRAFMGIATLANERGDVRLIERLSGTAWADVVRGSAIDGMIVARTYGQRKADLSATGVPFVTVADDAEPAERQLIVAMDEEAIGSIAARYYLDSGYQHFAVCTRPGIMTGFAARVGSFIRTVQAAGWQCAMGPSVPSAPGTENDFEDETSWAADAASWIAGLPKPLAVFAPYDYHARVVVNVAQHAGLRVPEDVAVIGVDDDDLYCMTTSPQLSSVVTPGRQVGQLALNTLLSVLNGEADVPRRILVPPPTILVRGSSSDFAIHDADVIEAVRFIREHAVHGISVEEVATHVALSRRTLERRFAAALSHTIRDEIRRAKVNRAKRLLIETDLPYAEVARLSGLLQQQQLNRQIRLFSGQTPVELRKAARAYRSAE